MTTLVVGGGWSGLAAAVTLSQHNQPVTVLESAKQLGGRARNVQWNDLTVDNGQHLMIGGYQTLLDYLRLFNADLTQLFKQLPLELNIVDPNLATLKLGAYPNLPWSLGLASYCLRHNSSALLWQIIRLQLNLSACLQQADQPVIEWLNQTKQSQRIITQLWEPLCLATLNTPINEASAHVFANVIKDMFKSRQAANLLIPKQPLGDLFPSLASDYIHNHHGDVQLQQRVKQLCINNNAVTGVVTADGAHIPAQQVILATSPAQTNKLLPAPIFELGDYPITTLYLQFEHPIEMPAMLGLTHSFSQWVFDRQHERAGLISIVISGPGEHEQFDNEHLIKTVLTEIQAFLTLPKAPVESLVIREKRATFQCNVGVQNKRPSNQTDIEGLYLAGDYIHSPYPATLETAVQSGQQAARFILTQR